MKPSELTIVIPIYGLWDSFVRLVHELDPEHPIVAVDDCSPTVPDFVSWTWARQRPFTLTRNIRNMGYGPACNEALAKVKTRYVCFLNTDMGVPTEDWWKPLAAHLKDPNVGAAGPQLRYPNGTIQHAGIGFLKNGNPYHIGRNCFPNNKAVREGGEAEALTGACLMARTEVIREANGFDPQYEVGNYEDIDLCLRLRQAGYKLIYEPSTWLTHYESQSVINHPRQMQWLQSNWLKFKERWIVDGKIVIGGQEDG